MLHQQEPVIPRLLDPMTQGEYLYPRPAPPVHAPG
jgi:hypothetical protein